MSVIIICFQFYRWNSTFSPFNDMDIFNRSQDLEHFNPINSTESEELSSMFNSTNPTTLVNSTIQDNSVPKELEIASLIFLWILSILRCFVLFNIKKYLKAKAPGSKTLLDEFYVKLISYWIFEICYLLAFMSVKMLWGTMPWQLFVLLFNINVLVILVPFLHLLFCLLCNLVLLFNPAMIEEIDDKKIIKVTL